MLFLSLNQVLQGFHGGSSMSMQDLYQIIPAKQRIWERLWVSLSNLKQQSNLDDESFNLKKYKQKINIYGD